MLNNPLLHRYWFHTTRGFGIGVTAFSREDAEGLIRDATAQVSWLPRDVVEVVEDVDISTLDANHVRPNMGVPTIRGIWFPRI